MGGSGGRRRRRVYPPHASFNPMSPRKKEAEAVEAPDECRRYDGPWREDVVKLCGEYGVKALAAMNVVELAQL